MHKDDGFGWGAIGLCFIGALLVAIAANKWVWVVLLVLLALVVWFVMWFIELMRWEMLPSLKDWWRETPSIFSRHRSSDDDPR